MEGDLRHHIDHLAHLLPAQGPITVFVHHNTLHAFEERKIWEAVAEGAKTFGCHPFLTESEYRAELRSGSFGLEDLEAALIEDLGDNSDGWIGRLGTRFALYFAMLEHPVHVGAKAELEWLIAETNALRQFRRETPSHVMARVVSVTKRWVLGASTQGYRNIPPVVARSIAAAAEQLTDPDPANWTVDGWEAMTLQLMWSACQAGMVHGLDSMDVPSPLVRHRDVLHQLAGIDSDHYVNDVLIRYCAAFLDQGFSQWALPSRSEGFYGGFLELYAQSPAPNEALAGLRDEIARLRASGLTPLGSIAESLEMLGIYGTEIDPFLASTFLALRGWAGMIHQIETRGDRVPLGIPKESLTEFLAVRLILDRLVLSHLIRTELRSTAELSQFRSMHGASIVPTETDQEISHAFEIFQIAQIRGWTPEELFDLSPAEWRLLIQEVRSLGSFERRRVFQLAFERGYRRKVLNAFGEHTRNVWMPMMRSGGEPKRPSFQIICCIDDREESFRRHLEELEPACETFGAPGFFAVPMYYRGASDAYFVPLCPIIMKPNHYVMESVQDDYQELHGRRIQVRKALGKQAHVLHKSSRSFVGGLALAAFGPLASIPMVARVLFPRLTASLRHAASALLAPPNATALTLERKQGDPGPDSDHLGFTVREMADAVERLLRDIGLTALFARLVVICGHGSSSLNNPHESAYNCGACGGGRGGPNARAVAAMANDSRVRALLSERGLEIPADTHFLGIYHNTCSDGIVIADRARLPETHATDFQHFSEVLNQARERNALERSRRFASASLGMSPSAALRHVEERSEDLSQTRPEYNHATNAICTVGRRSRTRGMFLDRRSFLVSYDPRQDDAECQILTRILSAVVPVCGGINLEYYFSRVDVAGYGCGSKLPHNVTSLIGVMDGAASDLRTGLSAQMVEIHDPLRLLFVIETRPESFLKIMERVPVVRRLCGNGWVQVATLSPDSDDMHLLHGDHFVPVVGRSTPLTTVANSVDWYRGWRGNLDFALISKGMSNGVAPR